MDPNHPIQPPPPSPLLKQFDNKFNLVYRDRETYGLETPLVQSQVNITVARPLSRERSMKNNRSSYDTPKPHPLSIVLQGRFAFRDVFVWRKVNNFLDSALVIFGGAHLLLGINGFV